jgi:cytochrome c oxidase cbb3-type subunit 4
METYNFLREVISSWALVVMMVIFIGIVAFTLRPGSREIHDDIAQIPFRNDKPGE